MANRKTGWGIPGKSTGSRRKNRKPFPHLVAKQNKQIEWPLTTLQPVPSSCVHPLDSVVLPGQLQPVCQTAFTAHGPGQGGVEPFNFSFFSVTGWGIDLDYCDIEWFALEMNRDHFVVFEIASKYCISDSFVDHDGYSISSKGFLPTICMYMQSTSCNDVYAEYIM